ncbi:amino acid permease [Saccharopolyspora shandongensis]|nr:amino acid permease [Saccharopolyspora shandongensis]
MSRPSSSHHLRDRHVTMIAMGGIIGAGLFMGSGAVLAQVGPGSFLTYAVTGVLILFVMRMLGEMAAARPSVGSFTEYARSALGDWAGFAMAWLYWYFWVVIVGFEAVAGAELLQRWVHWPKWVLALALIMLMTATNLRSTRSYGEFEYWFAGIKVLAIILFIGLGLAYVTGLFPGKGADISHLYADGGLLPHGGGVVFTAVAAVVLSMVGAEIVTVAAAESKTPQRSITKATNTVLMRISVFYVGSMFLVAAIVPWATAKPGQSPYVSALDIMGIPYGGDIMNIVVLFAVLSCLNSGLFTASRMLFVLARRNEAPQRMLKRNDRGVPMWAILASTLGGYVCVGAAYLSPDGIFSFLLNSSGAVVLIIYLLICLSQLKLRPVLARERPGGLPVKMWAHPILPIVTAAGIVAILAGMALDEHTRSQVALSVVAFAICAGIYPVVRMVKRRAGERMNTTDQSVDDAVPAIRGE